MCIVIDHRPYIKLSSSHFFVKSFAIQFSSACSKLFCQNKQLLIVLKFFFGIFNYIVVAFVYFNFFVNVSSLIYHKNVSSKLQFTTSLTQNQNQQYDNIVLTYPQINKNNNRQ